MTATETSASMRQIAYILLAVLTISISFLGLSDFYTRGEAREAIVAQSMVSSGNWVLPKAYNEAVPSKPPLFHWIAAIASLPIQQVNEFTTRLPSAICAVGALGIFLILLRPIFTSKTILLFTLLLTCSFEWLRASMSARVDMVHASCLASGLLLSFFAIEQSKIRYWMAAATLFALAALGKGPVAFAIPAMILSLWAWYRAKQRMICLASIACCLGGAALLTSTWYIAAYYQSPHEFVEKFWYENVSRFAGTMEDAPHKHSVFYLFGMLFIGVLPWSPYALWAKRKQLLELRYSFRSSWKNCSRIVQFSLFSIALIVLFYCIPSSKRSVYLLAAYPFIAIVLTNLLSEYLTIKTLRRLIYLSITIVILVQGIISPLFVAPKSSERALAKIVGGNLSPESKVYSFGFEFYGASFYSKQLFLRLENAFQEGKRHPALGDLVVCFEKEVTAMTELLKTHSYGVTFIAETSLNKNSVKLFRVSDSSKSVRLNSVIEN